MSNIIITVFKPLIKKYLLSKVNDPDMKNKIETQVMAKLHIPNVSVADEVTILNDLYQAVQILAIDEINKI
jgi:hypothetical protein